ncbi:ABC transporter ATP-binding protein [Cupriavidus sp. SK-4]|uniref:cyclic peptide export ABC transporter n=1 Tax=Cupriavidus sp. SK-4 TaxID=574750 RepID=UPI00044FE144|nr:cyclic peptide export ABC transporter [Cupriavidus sp. SK-4]EYS85594.1 ABC transporter ATP-binding protein [Cupriavidus sp. SK-4]
MNLFLSLRRRFGGLLLLALAAGTCSALAGIALIAEINGMIAAPAALEAGRIGVLLGLLAVLFGCGFGSQALLTALGHRVVYDMRLRMLKRVLDTDVERLEAIGGPTVYATLTKDIASIGMAFNRVPFVFYNGVLVLGGLLYLGWLSWQLFVLGAAVLGAGVLLAQRWVLRMRNLMKAVRDTDDRLYAGYQGAIDGRYELALNAWRKQSFYQRDFEPAAEFARAHEVRADRYWVLSLSFTATLILGLACAIFIAGDALGIARERITAFVLVLMFLRMPLNDLVGTLPILMTGNVALRKIETLRLAPYTEDFALHSANTAAAPPAPGTPLITLQDVRYDYPGQGDERGFRLGPVSLTLSAGETVFIVGGNGSGKSTLMKLLAGLYQPSAGSIALGDRPVSTAELPWYRSHFATVFSNAHLFARLVGPDGRFDAAVANAFLKRLHMDHKVAIRDDLLSTTQLSQGQRKRLALLAAYVEARPVLLLDEWAADQDPVFRAYFYESLLPELKRSGKTIVAVSHDDRYFHVADRVIRADSGVIRADSATDSAAAPAAAGQTDHQAAA